MTTLYPFSLSTTTENEKQSANGLKTEGADGEAPRVEELDLSSAKPLEAPTPTAPKGPMISSRSMGSKAALRKRRDNRTIKMEESKGRRLEQ